MATGSLAQKDWVRQHDEVKSVASGAAQLGYYLGNLATLSFSFLICTMNKVILRYFTRSLNIWEAFKTLEST